MGDKNARYTDVISDKERKIVYSVLDNYSFEVINCTRVRSSYKIETTTGDVCLKLMRHGRTKPNNGSILVQELVEAGFLNVVRYYKTKDDKFYVRHKKLLFYVVEWIEGKECDLDNIEEVLGCIKLLAQFHLATNNIDTNRFKLKNNLKNWPKIFNENLRDLEKYERIINNKKIKSGFDLSYYNCIENMYHRGMTALNFLNTSDYYKLSKQSNKNKTLCHASFYYQNIMKKDEIYYIIDLDRVDIDLHVNDLAKLIVRLMFKSSYKWDFNKAKIFIEAYTSINKLSKSELEVMLSLIIFPYKFCKLGKKRYTKNKAWDEPKYMHKLTKLIKYNDMQNKFLEDYLSYLNQYC